MKIWFFTNFLSHIQELCLFIYLWGTTNILGLVWGSLAGLGGRLGMAWLEWAL